MKAKGYKMMKTYLIALASLIIILSGCSSDAKIGMPLKMQRLPQKKQPKLPKRPMFTAFL